MNLIFFGSDRFAVAPLRRIHNSRHEILCVVTQPDRKAGRGMGLVPTPVKQLSQELNLSLHQTEDINSSQSKEFLKGLQAELFCVVAFGQILSSGILSIPKIFTINLHASLLPKYRGAAPINWALIRGETQTGVSVIKLVAKMDAGPIILQRTLDIKDNDDAQSLEDRLSSLGADSLLEALDLIQASKYSLIIQDEKEVTLAPKLKKEDGLICWDKPCGDILNLIRGCAGWPGAFTYYRDKILKVFKAKSFAGLPVCRFAGLPGKILDVSYEGIVVETGSDCLLIEELQLEGKRRMTVKEFIAGHKISVGEMLGAKI